VSLHRRSTSRRLVGIDDCHPADQGLIEQRAIDRGLIARPAPQETPAFEDCGSIGSRASAPPGWDIPAAGIVAVGTGDRAHRQNGLLDGRRKSTRSFRRSGCRTSKTTRVSRVARAASTRAARPEPLIPTVVITSARHRSQRDPQATCRAVGCSEQEPVRRCTKSSALDRSAAEGTLSRAPRRVNGRTRSPTGSRPDPQRHRLLGSLACAARTYASELWQHGPADKGGGPPLPYRHASARSSPVGDRSPERRSRRVEVVSSGRGRCLRPLV